MFRSLKNAIDLIKENHKFQKYFIFDKIVIIWEKEIDHHIQENTKIINFNNNIITIKTSTPTWKTELAFQKTKILMIINNHLDTKQKIKDIKFI